ncbi:hypothetical protein BS78_05G105600 [Paspalum vaginatum]|nr:hypothetical protein BS78_05G105600 [Paspalum vaginatum]
MASSSPATVIQIPSQTRTNDAIPSPASPTPKNKDGSDASQIIMPMTSSSSPTDKVMTSVANLAQLLPTGTVLAYQALSPSFTNHGDCNAANHWLTVVLVGLLTASSLFFSFTDSIVGRDRKLYYGVATPHGFNVFNFSGEEEERIWALGELKRLRLRPQDYVHAIFAAIVFLTVAFSDAGLQKCFFPDAGANTNELLKNLPLGMAALSSFVFSIFPTKRKGIGYNDTTAHNNA